MIFKMAISCTEIAEHWNIILLYYCREVNPVWVCLDELKNNYCNVHANSQFKHKKAQTQCEVWLANHFKVCLTSCCLSSPCDCSRPIMASEEAGNVSKVPSPSVAQCTLLGGAVRGERVACGWCEWTFSLVLQDTKSCCLCFKVELVLQRQTPRQVADV